MSCVGKLIIVGAMNDDIRCSTKYDDSHCSRNEVEFFAA